MTDSGFPKNPFAFPVSWKPFSLTDILAKPYTPPPWIIEDLLPKGSGLLVSGLPHAGKSINLLAAALGSVIQHKVWGKFDASNVNRVLYIETEDPAWMIEDRVRGLAIGFGMNPGQGVEKYGFGLACTGPFDLVRSHGQLEALIGEWKADWCVLSTLQGLLSGRDWKEQKDMGEVNACLVRMMRLCPLVVITHSPRGGERRAAGSITQDANYVTLMHFDKERRSGGHLVHVESDSKLGVELNFDLAMQLDMVTDSGKPRTQVRNITYQTIELTLREKIMAAIAQNPNSDPATIALLCGCSERYVRDILKGDKKAKVQ